MIRKGLITIILTFNFCVLFCQQRKTTIETFTSKNKKAIEYYKTGLNYAIQRLNSEAEYFLNQAIKKDEKFAEPYFLLAQLYKFNFNFSKSIDYFTKGLALQENNPKFSTFLFDFAELSLRTGDYQNASKYSEKYLNQPQGDRKYSDQAAKILIDCKFASENINKPIAFASRQLPPHVNSSTLQYFPSVTADGNTLVFTASNTFGLSGNEDLFITQKNDTLWSQPISISNKINTTRENEGTASISGDGKTIVFTACGRRDSRGNCDLYISYKTGMEWSVPTNMGSVINSPEWDSQPSLSTDGRTIYFVSMRKGGLGESDIYVSKKDEFDNWTKPENLGETINTQEKESSPFIHPNGTTLYFSSNGFPGMGGIDLYKSEYLNGNWTTPNNLGHPLNTSKDDQGLTINSEFTKGYYNSDIIKDGKMSTILFEFDVPTSIKGTTSTNLAKGKVFEAKSLKPLSAKIELIDLESGTLISKVKSDEISGDYTFVLNNGKEYALYCTKEGYLFKSQFFNYSNQKDFNPLKLDIELEPIAKGAHMILNNLFFESGKYNLQEKSITELNRLVEFMKKNPTLIVEVSGHTDNIGKADANLKLSSLRAQTVYDFLIKNEIPSASIKCKGYGDSNPIAPNTSEENRLLNRRIEFTIIDK